MGRWTITRPGANGESVELFSGSEQETEDEWGRLMKSVTVGSLSLLDPAGSEVAFTHDRDGDKFNVMMHEFRQFADGVFKRIEALGQPE